MHISWCIYATIVPMHYWMNRNIQGFAQIKNNVQNGLFWSMDVHKYTKMHKIMHDA